MTNTFTLSTNVTTKIGRLTDTTDYAALGFNLANANAKILGTITFQGEVIVQKLSVSSPLINLASGATYYEFPLELDQNGNVANGVYGVDLLLRMAPSNLQIGPSSANVLVGDGNPEYLEFLEIGDTLTFTGTGTENRTITDLQLVSGMPVYTLDQNVVFNNYDGYSFDVTHDAFEDTYNYAGCTLLTPCIEFTYDCTYGNSGTWSVVNSTLITTQTLVSLSGTINYPSWTGEDPITVTSLPYTNNILAKGTYTTNITQVISQTQTDGLIIVYTLNSIDEHKVVCVGPLCNLNPCIEKLRQANEGAILSGKVSPYQAAVDNVGLYFDQANNYQTCGDYENYEKTVAKIVATLDATGLDCGCGCGDTDSSQIGWVYNTSQSAQDAIEALQEEVANLPYENVLFDSGIIFATEDGNANYPNPQTYYRPFSDISALVVPKKYFDSAPNGYSKKFVQIEVTTATIGGGSGTKMNIVNVGNDELLYDGGNYVGDETITRHVIKLTSFSSSGSVFCCVAAESFQLDNVTPSVGTLDSFYNATIQTDLWDLTEDLTLNLTINDDGDASELVITSLKITAYITP